MTNAELIQTIKAEIERRLKDYWKICFYDVKTYNEDSNVRELKELLSFICTREESEKKAMNQDGLEEEIKRYYDDWDGDCRYVQTARHFAKWGAEHANID